MQADIAAVSLVAQPSDQNGGVLFLLWDEGSNNGDDPPFIVASPNAQRGFTSQAAYDTSAFLKTTQAILGVEALPCGANPDLVPVMTTCSPRRCDTGE